MWRSMAATPVRSDRTLGPRAARCNEAAPGRAALSVKRAKCHHAGLRSLCLALLLVALPALAADGRPPADDLYRRFEALLERGWILEVVAQSQPPGTTAPM